MTSKIVYHAPTDTYIIPKNAYFEEDILIRGHLIVGLRTTFWKNLCVLGTVRMGKGCVVKGDVRCCGAVISGETVIGGRLESDGDVSVFRNASIRAVDVRGRLTVMDGSVIGSVSATGELELIGRSGVGHIGRGTKVIVRSDAVLPENEGAEAGTVDAGPSAAADASGLSSGADAAAAPLSEPAVPTVPVSPEDEGAGPEISENPAPSENPMPPESAGAAGNGAAQKSGIGLSDAEKKFRRLCGDDGEIY